MVLDNRNNEVNSVEKNGTLQHNNTAKNKINISN